MAVKPGLNVRKDKHGNIVELTASDAHTLRVKCYSFNNGELLKHEAIVLPSLESLESLYFMTDPQDGYVYGSKWAIDKIVIKALRDHGDCVKNMPPFKFVYSLKTTKHADNLRHRG